MSAFSRARLALLLLLSLVLAAPIALPAQEGFVQTGLASFYGPEFHGRKTATGEKFSMWAMTAAHQTIPFNSLVRVTNLANGRNVIVRINDAGPFKDERIIDLSRAAAAKLDMLESGTARVKIEVIGKEGPDTHSAGDGSAFYRVSIDRAQLDGFAVQVASFNEMDYLIRKLNELEAKGIGNVYVQIARVREETVHRIVIGGFKDRDSAEEYVREIAAKGVKGFVFRVR